MFGYVFLGIAFGILMAQAGYGVWWSLAASALIFAGSMQFLMVELLTGGAGLLLTAGREQFAIVAAMHSGLFELREGACEAMDYNSE